MGFLGLKYVSHLNLRDHFRQIPHRETGQSKQVRLMWDEPFAAFKNQTFAEQSVWWENKFTLSHTEEKTPRCPLWHICGSVASTLCIWRAEKSADTQGQRSPGAAPEQWQASNGQRMLVDKQAGKECSGLGTTVSLRDLITPRHNKHNSPSTL